MIKIIFDEMDNEDIISVNGSLQPTTAPIETKETEETTKEATKEDATKEETTKETSTKEVVATDATAEQTTESTREEHTTEASISIPNENYEVYIVKAGDTLYSIALTQCGSVNMIEEIMSINKLEDEDYVIEGQKLLLP